MINHTNTMKRTLLLFLAFVALTAQAQQKNPRGVYKLTSMESTKGKFDAPFEQYKICTDKATLMLGIEGDGRLYFIDDNDHAVFNYTGEEPDPQNPKTPRIVNSNEDHFDLKWWSQYSGHVYFPENDWCTEHYEAGKFSHSGKAVYEALCDIPSQYEKESLYGTWYEVGEAKTLEEAKQLIANDNAEMVKGNPTFFSPSHIVSPMNVNIGMVTGIETNGKTYYHTGGLTFHIHWLPGDYMAINSLMKNGEFMVYKRDKKNKMSIMQALERKYGLIME